MEISLVNVTTNTQVSSGKRIYGGKAQEVKGGEDLSIVFLEFLDENGIKIEVPPRSCAAGHSVELSITTRGAKENISFLASGKVEESVVLPNKKVELDITLIKFDQNVWEALKGLFSNRQDEILNFFDAAKGG